MQGTAWRRSSLGRLPHTLRSGAVGRAACTIPRRNRGRRSRVMNIANGPLCRLAARKKERSIVSLAQLTSAPTTVLPPGTPAPDFSLANPANERVSLSQFRGRPVILAFYPADWSGTCGSQLALYNEVLPEFQAHNAELLGISV